MNTTESMQAIKEKIIALRKNHIDKYSNGLPIDFDAEAELAIVEKQLDEIQSKLDEVVESINVDINCVKQNNKRRLLIL